MSQLPGSARVNQYTASAGQTTFTYDFQIYDDDEITVQQNSTTLTLTTDYTVTGAGESGGGTIVLVTGATLDDTITLTGNTMVERETTFTNGGEFSASAINGEYNRILNMISENVTETDSIVKLAVYNESFNTDIPTPVADRCIKVNASGTGFEMSTYDPDDGSDSAAAAAASAAAAAISETNAGLSADEAEYWASSINLSAVGVDIVPDSDATRSLGKSNFEWAELHVTDCNVYNDLFVDGTMELLDDLTINVNKFTVDAATGNTGIAGTLTVTGDISYGGDTILPYGMALYTYEVTIGTSGGTATSGSYQTRPINTEKVDNIGITLSSNQLTLPAGSYIAHLTTSHRSTNGTKTRIYDITNSAELAIIRGGTFPTSSSNENMSGSGYFTLAASTVIEVQQQAATTVTTSGMGFATGAGTEVYLSLHLIKVA